MGWFLHSRLVTHVCVLVLVLFAGLATYYYAWSFSRKWPNPSTTTGVIKGFAMTFHALFGLFSLLTSHSIRISSQSIMFGTWTTCGFASIVFDSWWFGLMVSRKGFDLLEASRKGISVAFCVYSGFYAVYRLIVMLFVFHFDVRYNESLATTMGTVPASAQGMAASVAPSVVHIAGPAVSHHPPTTYQYPLSQHTVTQLRSLAKRLSIRRDSRRPFARLDQHDQEAHSIDPSDRQDGIDSPSSAGSRLSRILPRKWWPSHRGRASTEPPGASIDKKRVPLIRVSEHQEEDAAALDDAADRDDPILFDAISVGGSSLDSYELVGSPNAALEKGKGHEVWGSEALGGRGSGEFTSEDEELEDEQEAQRAYEERRRRRRQARGSA